MAIYRYTHIYRDRERGRMTLTMWVFYPLSYNIELIFIYLFKLFQFSCSIEIFLKKIGPYALDVFLTCFHLFFLFLFLFFRFGGLEWAHFLTFWDYKMFQAPLVFSLPNDRIGISLRSLLPFIVKIIRLMLYDKGIR